jgi:UDP-N-acetylglucosamine/UDP-N-acetylgalactosamine diphosphorylase
MAGGTSRKDHSEVGSSYIHFNYTPHQDKATASLVGDVPRGVMLDQRPIFLGGQGGLVGPCRIAYGCVVPAGTIRRHDAPEPGHLLIAPPPSLRTAGPYRPEVYGRLDRLIANNLAYLGNIVALQEWYRLVRGGLMAGDAYSRACHQGAMERLGEVRTERIKRLEELTRKVARSLEVLRAEPGRNAVAMAQQEAFCRDWPRLETRLAELNVAHVKAPERDLLLAKLSEGGPGGSYVKIIQSLPAEARAAGTAWLQGVVDTVTSSWQPPAVGSLKPET